MDKQAPLKNKGLVTRSIEAYRPPIALGALLLSLNGIPVQRKLPPTVFQYQVLLLVERGMVGVLCRTLDPAKTRTCTFRFRIRRVIRLREKGTPRDGFFFFFCSSIYLWWRIHKVKLEQILNT